MHECARKKICMNERARVLSEQVPRNNTASTIDRWVAAAKSATRHAITRQLSFFFCVVLSYSTSPTRPVPIWRCMCVRVCACECACVRMSEKSFYNFSFIKLDRRRRRSRCCKHTKNAFASELREFSSTMFPYHI